MSLEVDAVTFDHWLTLCRGPQVDFLDVVSRIHQRLVEERFKVEKTAFVTQVVKVRKGLFETRSRTGKEFTEEDVLRTSLAALGVATEHRDEAVIEALEEGLSLLEKGVHTYPETKRVLRSLMPRYKLGLISNTSWAPLSRRVLASLGLDTHFEVMVFSSEFGHAKPHPSIFLHTAKQLSVSASRCLHVGDDLQEDVKGALDAGMQSAYLRRSERQIPGYPESNVTEVPPQAILLKTLPELLDHLLE